MQQRDSWRGKKADPLKMDVHSVHSIRPIWLVLSFSALISFLIICTKQLWNWLRMLNMKKQWFLAQKRKKTYSIYVKPMNWLIFCNVEQELAHQFVNQRKYVCSFESSHLFFYTSISLSALFVAFNPIIPTKFWLEQLVSGFRSFYSKSKFYWKITKSDDTIHLFLCLLFVVLVFFSSSYLLV